MEVITLECQPFNLGDFLRESMLSQRFADLALCCSSGHKFLAHRLVLSAASPYLQEVLLAHSNSVNCCEPVTVILAEVEGPALASLLGFVYTGRARVPRTSFESFLRTADALQIRLPSLPPLPSLRSLPSLPTLPSILNSYRHCRLDHLLNQEDLPSQTTFNITCKEVCCQRPLTKRQVANQVTASPWSQTARPHHLPRRKLMVPQHQPQLPHAAGYGAGYGGSTEEQAVDGLILKQVSPNWPVNEASLSVSDRLGEEIQVPSLMEEDRTADPSKQQLQERQLERQERQKRQEVHHQCEQCNKSFVSGSLFKVHLKSHSGEKPYQCADCGKQFSQLRNYKYHRSVHEGTREFAASCTVCGKYFNDRGYLSSHMKIHRNRKEYGCTQCGKSFNQRVAYNMHLRIHTGLKPHQCNQCGKTFSRKMLLKQHMRTHSGERPYQCQLCDKAFADRSNMMLHTRLHSGQKPYKCSICSKAFTKKHHLKTHLNYHTGIKPYACPNCQITFSQSSNMRTHYKKCTTKQFFSFSS